EGRGRHRPTNTSGEEITASADDEQVLAARDELADDRSARDLAGDDQAAGGLRIREQQCLRLVDVDETGVGAYPVQVAPGAAADVAGRGGFPRTVEIPDRGGVDDRGDPAGPGQLEDVAEQAESGDVGGASAPALDGGLGCVAVERGHRGDRG